MTIDINRLIEFLGKQPSLEWLRQGSAGHMPQDIVKQVMQAMDAPLEFPAVHSAVLPGDRVAIALQRGVPQVAAVLEGLLLYLTGHNINFSDISVVVADPADQPDAQQAWVQASGDLSRRVEVHDRINPQENAYLLASAEGQPVYINRRIFDADVVVPVGAPATHQAATSWEDTLGSGFCDESTLQQLRDKRKQAEQRQLVDQINDNIGAFWQIQVVPGVGGSAQSVIVGRRDVAAKRATHLARDAWQRSIEALVPMVIVTIEGPRREQTWDALTRALFTAGQVTKPQGIIVLCTHLEGSPDELGLKAESSNGSGQSMRAGQEIDLSRALAGCQHVLDEHPTYLISQLDDDLAEQLGFTPIATLSQLNNLIASVDSCLVIRDAHKCHVTVG